MVLAGHRIEIFIKVGSNKISSVNCSLVIRRNTLKEIDKSRFCEIWMR